MTIMIQAVNVSTITQKIKEQIDEWPGLEGRVKVRRAEVINEDFSKTPWVGIYRQRQEFEARTLGLGTGYRRHNITFALVIQESSVKSGQECEEKMEKLISEVVSAICSDESIRGTCQALAPNPFQLTYSSYRNEGNSFFQEAVLQFTVVTNVNATVS